MKRSYTKARHNLTKTEKTSLPATSDKALISQARPEIELLLCCARTFMDDERAKRIRALIQDKLDWEYLIRMAHRHGLMPLLHQQLNTICPELVPESHSRTLRDQFNRNTARNLCLTDELCKVLKLFEAHDIPTVPYKGPALAVSVYGNLSLRQFGDLDILVHQQDVFRAGEILESQNYRPQFQLSNVQKEAYLGSKNDYPLLSNDANIFIEIHWNFIPAYLSLSLDTERLWKRLGSISLNGMKVSTFSPEDLLLILCVHSTKHMWQRLSWISDIAELINRYKELDWEIILQEAEISGTRRMLFLGLFLANRALGVELPANLIQLVHDDPSIISLGLQAEGKWFEEIVQEPHILELTRFYFKSIESASDRIRYCLSMVLTPVPGDWSYINLPDRLYMFYYLIRPYRLVIKYLLRPLTRLRQRSM
jgi:hypothetical protein